MADSNVPNKPTHPAATTAGDEAGKIAGQLLKEGARGAVLLGAARLDQALETLLKSFMQPNPGGEDNLFDTDRPLGTFSAKIALAYRLGLIDKSVEHALQMIRKVRNAFAHSFEDATLTDHAHRNRLAKPYADAQRCPLWARLQPEYMKAPSVTKELSEYICLVTMLVSFIEAAVHFQKPSAPPMLVGLPEGLRGLLPANGKP